MSKYIFIPILLAVAAAGAVGVWYGKSQPQDLRLPDKTDTGPDDKPLPINGKLEGKLGGKPSDIKGEWTQFRGPNMDNISTDPTPLARTWPAGGPPVLWSQTVGQGHAGVSISQGRVYLVDYDKKAKRDIIRCMSLDDGKDIWRFSYPVEIRDQHGMSRGIGTIAGDYIVTLGPKCHVVCLDKLTGEFKWGIDLVGEYKTVVPDWYASQSPLIDGDKVILAPGGTAMMMAVELKTGKVLWKTPNPDKWDMTHVSIVPVESALGKMYVWCGSKGVVGVSAADGSVMWQNTKWWIAPANVPTPVPVGDGRLFLSGGYGKGSMMLKLEEKDGRIEPRELFALPAKTFGAVQHTPIFYKGNLYGIRPDGQLVCLDLDGKVLWTSPATRRFGSPASSGPFMLAGGMIYVMDDNGWMSLVEARPDAYVELSRARIVEDHDTWGCLAVVGGRMIARGLTKMVCVDVAAK